MEPQFKTIVTKFRDRDIIHIKRVIRLIEFLNKLEVTDIGYDVHAPRGFNGAAVFVQYLRREPLEDSE